MYKTVRHGENSLQYTILPQTEEVLNTSGIKGRGRDYSPPPIVDREKLNKARVWYGVVLTLGLVITMMIVVVPICALSGVLSSRTLIDFQEFEESGPLTPVARELVKVRRKELKEDFVVMTDMPSESTTSSTTVAPQAETQASPAAAPAGDAATSPHWTMPALRSWKSSTAAPKTPDGPAEDSPFIGTPSGSIQLLEHYISLTPWDSEEFMHPTEQPDISTLPGLEYFGHAKSKPIPPGVPTETIVTRINKVGDFLVATKTTLVPIYDSEHPPPAVVVVASPAVPVSTSAVPALSSMSTSSSLKDLKETLLSVDDDDEFKESLEVDEVFSLPPLPPLRPAPPRESLEPGWLGARWPFVTGATSYFQWARYMSHKNLLLPLMVALASLLGMLILLVIALQRRRRHYLSIAKRLRRKPLEPQRANLLAAAEEEPEPEE